MPRCCSATCDECSLCSTFTNVLFNNCGILLSTLLRTLYSYVLAQKANHGGRSCLQFVIVKHQLCVNRPLRHICNCL